MINTPSPGTCTPSYTRTRPTATSFNVVSNETNPCANPQGMNIGHLADPTTFARNEPKDLAENEDPCVKPFFFHRPSTKCRPTILLKASRRSVLNRVRTMNKFVTVLLTRVYWDTSVGCSCQGHIFRKKDLTACGAETPLPPCASRDIPHETIKVLVDCLVSFISSAAATVAVMDLIQEPAGTRDRCRAPSLQFFRNSLARMTIANTPWMKVTLLVFRRQAIKTSFNTKDVAQASASFCVTPTLSSLGYQFTAWCVPGANRVPQHFWQFIFFGTNATPSMCPPFPLFRSSSGGLTPLCVHQHGPPWRCVAKAFGPVMHQKLQPAEWRDPQSILHRGLHVVWPCAR